MAEKIQRSSIQIFSDFIKATDLQLVPGLVKWAVGGCGLDLVVNSIEFDAWEQSQILRCSCLFIMRLELVFSVVKGISWIVLAFTMVTCCALAVPPYHICKQRNFC